MSDSERESSGSGASGKPSQAEGGDPGYEDEIEGKPSQAEGDEGDTAED
jgi:hypothetical protein